MDIIDYQTHKVRFESQREHLVINITQSKSQGHAVFHVPSSNKGLEKMIETKRIQDLGNYFLSIR